jgi:hypothetical protein
MLDGALARLATALHMPVADHDTGSDLAAPPAAGPALSAAAALRAGPSGQRPSATG